MVCIDVIKSPRREREGAASVRTGTSRASARVVSGRARSGGRGGGREDGGAGVEGFEGLLIVFMPPPGAGGGSKRPDGHVPSASEGACPDGREAGEGAGVGKRAVETFNDYDK